MNNNMRVYNDIRMISLPKIEDIQYYIYAIENELGYVKIGISQDITQRVRSLSGSNTGGNKIIRIAPYKGTLPLFKSRIAIIIPKAAPP